MQPSGSPPENHTTIPTRQLTQQPLPGQDKRRAGSLPSHESPLPPFRAKSGWVNATSHAAFPASKKVKTSHREVPTMVRTSGIINRPGVVDLTRPAKFPIQEGPKRLVIKNLRTTPQDTLEAFYKKTWADLDAALTANFKLQQPSTPLEVLCRGVEALCRRGRGEQLAKHVKHRSKTYLEKDLVPLIEKEAGSDDIGALRAVHKYWNQWNEQSIILRSIFCYLDRSYLLTAKDSLQLEDQGIHQFRNAVFQKGTVQSDRSLGGAVIAGICELIEHDRIGPKELFDHTLLRDAIAMLHVFGIYGRSFEPLFLKQSGVFFEEFAEQRSSSSMRDYISSCDMLLQKESLRCDMYNLDSSTKRALLDHAHTSLIRQRSTILLDPQGLAKLIEDGSMASLKALYSLLGLSQIQAELKDPWEEYIRAEGSKIVGDKDRADDMVVRLLELKRSLDLIVRDAFFKDDSFTYALREAFSNFINDRKNLSAWGVSNSKVGEMIAKYIDALLRGGLKAVPRSLIFDAKDRDSAEKQGQGSTGDEDAELDLQLEQGLELFRFIEGKDVFEAFYKKDLARRLLMGRSASQDAERNMLAKLKAECGFTFTHNLEQMFKDQDVGRDEMASFKELVGSKEKTNLDLQVSVLSSSAWPSYPDVAAKLPDEVATQIEKFDRHYKHKHSGRKLTWKHALAHSVVRAHFNKGTRELVVSGFQALVLVLFNNIGADGHLSYSDIATATGLIDAELQRTLQSLACAKFRILTKHPKGRDVNATDTFTVNSAFWDQKYRIKINQIQLKETKEENRETHERVYQDRQYETQAAIVRIMKARKSLAHQSLVAEVINATKGRGMVELGEIKKNIEKLIEKEYIEREGSSYIYLA